MRCLMSKSRMKRTGMKRRRAELSTKGNSNVSLVDGVNPLKFPLNISRTMDINAKEKSIIFIVPVLYSDMSIGNNARQSCMFRLCFLLKSLVMK